MPVPADYVQGVVGDRLSALISASSKQDQFNDEHLSILHEAVPKAPEGNNFYEIRLVPNKGFGCFAITPLRRGTRVLADSPLLVVPVASYLHKDIQAEFDKLSAAEQALYFTLHSGHGQDPKKWPSQIHPNVTGHERERIVEQHEARVGKQASLISIFQTNCMEMDRSAAIFPHAARFNHSCNPNACFTWNSAIQKETIHLMRNVEEGEEMTLSYCDMTHDKALRSWELKHYGFECNCPACGDNTDPHTFAGKSAERRYRLQDLLRETKHFRRSTEALRAGAVEEGFVNKLLEMAKLHKDEGDWTARLAEVYRDMAIICELARDLDMAEKCALMALQVKRDAQGADYPGFDVYRDLVHRVKYLRYHQ